MQLTITSIEALKDNPVLISGYYISQISKDNGEDLVIEKYQCTNQTKIAVGACLTKERLSLNGSVVKWYLTKWESEWLKKKWGLEDNISSLSEALIELKV